MTDQIAVVLCTFVAIVDRARIVVDAVRGTVTGYMMKTSFALVAGALMAASIAVAADAPPADAWRTVDPDNLLLIDTRYGQTVIELAPQFAPEHVKRMKAMVRAHFFDGKTFYRVIDGYVAQAGIENDTPQSRADWPALKAEFDRPDGPDIPFTPLGSPDLWAPEVGHVAGFAVGHDPKEGKMWLLHCPGSVAFARDPAPDTASTEFYVVLGEAPRRLDRNLTVFARVIAGMQYLQKLKRGDSDTDSGVIKPGPGRDPILHMRLAADMPEKQRPHFAVLKTESDYFAKDKQARMHPGTSFLVREPPPVLDICNVSVSVRQVKL